MRSAALAFKDSDTFFYSLHKLWPRNVPAAAVEASCSPSNRRRNKQRKRIRAELCGRRSPEGFTCSPGRAGPPQAKGAPPLPREKRQVRPIQPHLKSLAHSLHRADKQHAAFCCRLEGGSETRQMFSPGGTDCSCLTRRARSAHCRCKRVPQQQRLATSQTVREYCARSSQSGHIKLKRPHQWAATYTRKRRRRPS